jgi:hypothetical protein
MNRDSFIHCGALPLAHFAIAGGIGGPARARGLGKSNGSANHFHMRGRAPDQFLSRAA